MNDFEAILYEKENGEIPVEKFLDNLPIKMKAKVVVLIQILQEFGNDLRQPYSKHLEDGIFELRTKQGRDITRVLYFFYFDKKVILTNGFVKKTQKRQSLKSKKQKNTEMILWKGQKMKAFDNYLKEQLENKEFANEYKNIQPDRDIIRAIVSARTSQNLTQKQLSEKTGIDQSDISKLENGTRNPSINLLKRLADGLGMDLKIEFVKKNTQISK